MSQPSPPTLRDLLESLPQELYDEIYDLTFTPTTNIAQINKNFRVQVPNINLLQVDHATRKSYIESLTFAGKEWQTIKCVQRMPQPLRTQLRDVRTFEREGERRTLMCGHHGGSYHRYLAGELNHGVWKSFVFESEMMASLEE